MLSKARTKKTQHKTKKGLEPSGVFFVVLMYKTVLFYFFLFSWFDIKQNEVFSTPDQVSGNWLCFLVQFKGFLIGLLMCTK